MRLPTLLNKKNYIIPLSSSYFNLLFALCHFLKVFYTLFINSNCLFYTILTSFDMHRHYIILSKKWNILFDKWVCPKIITAGTLGFILSRGRDNFYYISCACIKRTGQLEGEMVEMLLCDISIGNLTCQLLFQLWNLTMSNQLQEDLRTSTLLLKVATTE